MKLYSPTCELANPKYLTSVGPKNLERKFKPSFLSELHILMDLGQRVFSRKQILTLMEKHYALAGSKNAKAKASRAWGFYANPKKDGWFVVISA